MAAIQDLPNELLAYIFSFLDVQQRLEMELVCRRWSLIGKEVPWKNPTKLVFIREGKTSTATTPNNVLNDKNLASIFRRCGPCLKELTLSSKYNIRLTCESIFSVGHCCPNLEVLNLHIPISSACLKAVAFGCPNLKVVKILNFGNKDHEEGLLNTVQSSKSLECLEVDNIQVGEKWFDVVNQHLRKLCLIQCTIYSAALRNLTRGCHCLQHLELPFAVFNEELAERSDYGFTIFEVFEHFRNTLKILKFEDVTLDWCERVGVLSNLEELCLVSCGLVHDDLMAVLASECTQLQKLDISHSDVSDEGLLTLAALPSLKVLDVSYMHISGDGLQALATVGILEEISMRGVDEILEENCCALAKLCTNLRCLDVSGTHQITDRLVKSFCNAIQIGLLKGPVKLITGQTSVKRNVRTCHGIQVDFTSQSNVSLSF